MSTFYFNYVTDLTYITLVPPKVSKKKQTITTAQVEIKKQTPKATVVEGINSKFKTPNAPPLFI